MAAHAVHKPLSGIRVLEFEGIGPAPLGCCVLADFGADVVSISRASKGNVRSQVSMRDVTAVERKARSLWSCTVRIQSM